MRSPDRLKWRVKFSTFFHCRKQTTLYHSNQQQQNLIMARRAPSTVHESDDMEDFSVIVEENGRHETGIYSRIKILHADILLNNIIIWFSSTNFHLICSTCREKCEISWQHFFVCCYNGVIFCASSWTFANLITANWEEMVLTPWAINWIIIKK